MLCVSSKVITKPVISCEEGEVSTLLMKPESIQSQAPKENSVEWNNQRAPYLADDAKRCQASILVPLYVDDLVDLDDYYRHCLRGNRNENSDQFASLNNQAIDRVTSVPGYCFPCPRLELHRILADGRIFIDQLIIRKAGKKSWMITKAGNALERSKAIPTWLGQMGSWR